MTTPAQDQHWQHLMHAAQQGDSAAYATLLRELTPLIQRFVRSRIFDADLAEDISQDVLIALHRARHTYNPEQPFMPWLNAIIRFKSIDGLRKWSRHKEHERPDSEFVETFSRQTTKAEQEAILDREALSMALSALPAKQRRIVVLLKLHGLSIAEASKVTGMSVSAVKVSAHRAYKTLQQHLNKEADL